MASCMQNTEEGPLGYVQSLPRDVRARYEQRISVIGVPSEGDYGREREWRLKATTRERMA